MKISLRKGQILFLTVKAPQSGEVFQIPLELEDDGIRSYSNLETEALKEAARVQIRQAAEMLKNPANYTATQGYNNLMAVEHGVGSKNPAVAQVRKDKGLI